MRRIITLLQVLFLCVFIGCGAYFGKLYYDKRQTEKEMETVQSIKNHSAAEAETVPMEEKPQSPPKKTRAENGMFSEYYSLYQMNEDTAGWVKINGTVIDYPVMYNEDSNAYYLHRGFDRSSKSAGMIFMDYQCDRNGDSMNTILYGHNMRNGTMFHSLLKYEKKEFWSDNPSVNFDTLYKRGSYEIFAVFRTSVGSKNEFKYYEFINSESKEQFDEFISQCKTHSLYDTGITPVYGERLLTLSTCSYNSNNERFVVVAVKRS